MVQKYNIFGTQVASQYLAMGVLGTMFGGIYAMTGGSAKTPAAPPINASSPDEADFIKCAHPTPCIDLEASRLSDTMYRKFIEQADSAEKKEGEAKH
ncbi:hypothetical protein N0V88_006970 [Collariella sp. IMI 366227]|nr:hypothetical protein N0V88_006970 [Collariella sp. IMI 366227]